MCGIAGIWRFNGKVEQDEIRAITDSMRHRGPDGAGYEVFDRDGLAFGHRRLSILDLTEAGKQPMHYADKRYWLTFNGEIYNFIEIRKELSLKGHSFISDTDSEVILAAYTEWGVKCFQKFNGMWAIAIWDNTSKELLLCRDRFGVKPLHYLYIPGKILAFASETVAFRQIKNYQRAYDQDNLIRALHRHNVLEPSGRTIYKSIQQVLPGTFLHVTREGIKENKWWKTTEHFQEIPKTFEAQKEQFLSLFYDACKLRLRSDVPVGSALSGGIDSTAVYCTLMKVMQSESALRVPKDWQKAFSISFPGSEVDERKYIQSVLDQTKGTGVITEPKNDNLLAELQLSTRMSDFVSGTPLACLTYVYKSMHQHGIVVSMDGHGVDEYLYGYTSSVSQALLQSYLDGDTQYSQDLETTLRDMNFSHKGMASVERVRQRAKTFLESRKGWKYVIKDIGQKVIGERRAYYTLPKEPAVDLFSTSVNAAEKILNVESYYNMHKNLGEQRLLEEFHYIDLPYNLRDFDRGAMQNQIEIRMPFMDYRLVTYTMSLPQKSKLNKGFTKFILREAMKGIMPEDIRTRKLKIGLGAPLKDWFNDKIDDFLVDLVNSTPKDVSFLNWKHIKEVVETNCKNKTWSDASASQYWPIINYLLLDL